MGSVEVRQVEADQSPRGCVSLGEKLSKHCWSGETNRCSADMQRIRDVMGWDGGALERADLRQMG